MDQKWQSGIWGAALGAFATMVVGFWAGGWTTSSTAARLSEVAVSQALLPVCADAIMANAAAVADLKKKRPTDFDDVVRDHLKAVGNRTTLDSQFRRDCGKAIEARLAASPVK